MTQDVSWAITVLSQELNNVYIYTLNRSRQKDKRTWCYRSKSSRAACRTPCRGCRQVASIRLSDSLPFLFLHFLFSFRLFISLFSFFTYFSFSCFIIPLFFFTYFSLLFFFFFVFIFLRLFFSSFFLLILIFFSSLFWFCSNYCFLFSSFLLFIVHFFLSLHFSFIFFFLLFVFFF